MAAKFLGAHMPTKGGLGQAVRNGAAIGCTAIQVFTNSPQTWKAKPITDAMVEDFQLAMQETGVDHIVSHDSYLVNLANPDPEKRHQSIEGLKAELARCARYGIRYAVSHLGAHLGEGEEAGLQRVEESLEVVLGESDPSVMVLAETTAGQGSSLDWKIEHLAQLMEGFGATGRLGICVDTCHLFAAGYDLRTPESYEAFWERFDDLIGVRAVKAIHCNDSKKPLGSRVDRHEAIGEGEIGITAFECLVNDPRWTEVPILLETPDAETQHAVNLKRLQALIRPA